MNQVGIRKKKRIDLTIKLINQNHYNASHGFHTVIMNTCSWDESSFFTFAHLTTHIMAAYSYIHFQLTRLILNVSCVRYYYAIRVCISSKTCAQLLHYYRCSVVFWGENNINSTFGIARSTLFAEFKVNAAVNLPMFDLKI